MRRRLLRAARPLSLAAAALVLAAAGAAAADISPTYEANAVPWGDGGGTTWAKIGAPAGLAASPDGKRFYVADSGNHRIGVLGPEGRQGFLDMWGGTSPGKGPRQFDDPRGVAVDPWGTVVVADTGNERIQRIASDGTYLGSIDLPGVVAVATDSVGSIYALSRFFNTVVWMTSTGKRIAVWQARPPVAAEPLEAWSHPPTGNTKPRMTVRRDMRRPAAVRASW
jgi:DNA-binding beta-propeller fold protein YncE